MSCQELRPQISSDLDGQLSDHESSVVREHLTGCAACRLFREEQVAMLDWMRSTDLDEEPPIRIWEAIERRIDVPRPSQEPKVDGSSRGWFFLPQWRLALGALLVVFVGGLSLVQFQSHDVASVALAELEAYEFESDENPYLPPTFCVNEHSRSNKCTTLP